MTKLEIIRPLSKQEFSVVWLELNTPEGNFVIQPKHAPMVLTLSPNKDVIFCLKNGKQQSITVQYGVAEITREKTTILLNE